MPPIRFEHLAKAMNNAQVDCVALNPGPTFYYLTGLNFHLMERPVILVVNSALKMALILPQLEVTRAQQSNLSFHYFSYDDNPANWLKQFKDAASFMNLTGKTLAIEPTRLRYLEMNYLQQSAEKLSFTSGEGIFGQLRMRKDDDELAAMRKAAKIAQQALESTLANFKPGLTEREIASELSLQLLQAGSSIELPFAPIVSGGPNSADPHASPSDRKVEQGDLLLIDWGAACQGYASDITRTFAVGEVDPELKRIADIVKSANAEGRKAGRPGIPAGEVDQAARNVIEEAGYGEHFIHRVGHGLGLEAHEPPYMFGENDLTLQPGMTYTVEPGIYLPGKGGVRIEDDVVVTENGAESLTDLPRDLVQLSL